MKLYFQVNPVCGLQKNRSKVLVCGKLNYSTNYRSCIWVVSGLIILNGGYPMSGRKRATVSLNEKDRQRVQESSDRFLRLEQDILAIRARVQENRQDDIDRTIQDVASRQAQFSESIFGIDEQLREIEDRTSSQLVEQANYFFQQSNAVGEEVLQQTTNILDDYSSRLWAVMEQTKNSQQAQFRQIKEYLAGQKKNTQNRQAVARSVLESAAALNEALKAIYHEEIDRIALLGEMDQALHMAWQNFESGFLDAAVLTGQETYQNLSKFRLEMENFILTRQAAINQAAIRYEELYQSILQHQTIHAMDLAGELLDHLIDTNEWTGGSLAELEAEVSHYAVQFDQLPAQAFTLDILAHLEEHADYLQDHLAQIIQQARLEVLASQVRYEIADTIKNALLKEGYDVVDANYLGEDLRNGFAMTLTNSTQDEIDIQINPIAGEVTSYRLDIVTPHAERYNPSELRWRGKYIKTSLEDHGLEIGQVKVPQVRSQQPDQFDQPEMPENAPPSPSASEDASHKESEIKRIRFKKNSS